MICLTRKLTSLPRCDLTGTCLGFFYSGKKKKVKLENQQEIEIDLQAIEYVIGERVLKQAQSLAGGSR